MKVGELHTILESFPQEMEICVNGYEGGVGRLLETSIKVIKVEWDVNTEYYYGEHEPAGYTDDGDELVNVVILSRENYSRISDQY